MRQATSVGEFLFPGSENDVSRSFFLGSVIVSVFCLGFIVRHRLGVNDPYSAPIFWNLLINQDYWAALLIVGLLAVALLSRNSGPTIAVVRAIGNHPNIVAGVAFVAFCVGAVFAYHDYPLSMDEYSVRFQSEVFAAGHLIGHYPVELLDWLIAKPFQKSFLIVSRPGGEVVSYFMPGFALLLTPFTFLGIPWASNPAIGALSLVAVHRLARELCASEEAGGWAILFALASPAFSINAMSYYSMSANLLFSTVYTLLLLRPTPGKALAAGMVGGFALVMHSPPPHMLYAAPWIVWLLVRREFRCFVALALGYIPFAGALGVGWLQLLGDLRSAGSIHTPPGSAAATVPYAIRWMAAIGKIANLPDAHTVLVRVGGLVKLWVWAVPGLPILAWFGFLKARTDPRYGLLLASAITTFLGYFLIPFDQGHGWGYRYFHSAWGVLAVLAAAAMVRVPVRSSGGRRFVAAVGALALGSLLLSTSLRVMQVNAFIERHLGQVPLADTSMAQVAFIDTSYGYYTIDMLHNYPPLTRKVLFMISHGRKENAEMAHRLHAGARRVTVGAWGELWLLE
ncbi:MAG: hypothetical protein A3G25_11745 [Betaproteobacteria bacterium RIFCSPLOWO2_12_FULL_63_13]|nr:MAG: hypothetical protein A3H32_09145 [Betaproteobacteria bacterium RIFCSPLOWO2_02_FULL_63_19]OGA54393.1 MAG: hypothetical protein A3G25_11745 [Betaproteobacteria bacterium RIFCSPLOWO2_12_FULL_63_13]